jgi:hypothetical protein
VTTGMEIFCANFLAFYFLQKTCLLTSIQPPSKTKENYGGSAEDCDEKYVSMEKSVFVTLSLDILILYSVEMHE